MARSTIGLFVGLTLAFALVFGGFGDMLVVALFGTLGYLTPKLFTGEIDADAVLTRLRGQ